MTQNQETHSTKVQSAYPALQSILPRLRALNPDRTEPRPTFSNKAKARLFIGIQQDENGRHLLLAPVWNINHIDLEASEIRGWTATHYAC